MRASFGGLPVLVQFVLVAVAAQRRGAQIDAVSLVQLSAESRQPSLMGGRKQVEAHGEEAKKQAVAIEKVREHHARMEQLRKYNAAVDQLIHEEKAGTQKDKSSAGKLGKYKVAVDQLIHEEKAGTQKDKSSAGIPSDLVEPSVVNLASDGFTVRADGQQKLLQIPRALRDNKVLKDLNLRVDAEFEHLGSQRCGGAFMKSLSFFGNWTGRMGVVALKPGSDQANTTMLIDTRPKFQGTSVSLEFGGVTFRVEKQYSGRGGQPRSYLDVSVSGLRHHHDVGGILGLDDHTQAELPGAGCLPAQASSAGALSAMVETGSTAAAAGAGSRAVVVD